LNDGRRRTNQYFQTPILKSRRDARKITAQKKTTESSRTGLNPVLKNFENIRTGNQTDSGHKGEGYPTKTEIEGGLK